MIVLRAAGVELAGPRSTRWWPATCSMPGERSHNLDDLAKRHLNHGTIKISELIGSGKKQKRMDEVPLAQVTRYAAEDADVPLRLRPILERPAGARRPGRAVHVVGSAADRRAGRPGVQRHPRRSGTAGRAERPVRRADAAARGRNLSPGRPRVQHRLAQAVAGGAVQGAEAAARQRTNTRAQHRRRRAGGAGLAPPAAGQDHRVSPVRQAQEHVRRCAAAADPSARRAACTRRSTRTWPPPAGSAPATRTCRTSPSAREQGREIRSAFLPGEPGWKLLAADYSQIELRVLAHFSGDATLRAAFADDEDIHTPRRQRGLRRAAGRSDQRHAPQRQGRELRRHLRPRPVRPGQATADRHRGGRRSSSTRTSPRYPGVARVPARRLWQTARANGYVSTILGRRRAIHGVRLGDDPPPTKPA